MYFYLYYSYHLHIYYCWQTDTAINFCWCHQWPDITSRAFHYFICCHKKKDHERLQTSFVDAIGRMDRCFSNGLDGMDNRSTDYFKIVMVVSKHFSIQKKQREK